MTARLLTAARQYTQAKFKPIPLRPNDKIPILPRWQDRDPLDDDEIERYWGNGNEHNLGLVCGLQPSGMNLLAIDVDPRHGGDEDMADLFERLGPLPPSPRHDTPSGGYHLFFSMPSDYTLQNVKLADGVDTRSGGGQVVAPPSTINGVPYQATIQTSVLRCPIPPLPNAWVAELRGRGAPVAASIKRHPASQGLTLGEMAGGWRPFDYVNDHLVFTEALLRHGWTEMRGERWCRPGKNPRDGHSAELHDGRKLVIFTSDIPDVVRAIGLPTVGGFVSLTLSDFLIAYEHGGDVGAFKRWARERYGPQDAGSQRAVPGPDSPEEAGTPPARDNDSPPNLPSEFWEARRALVHLRDAAWSAGRSPDALLMAWLPWMATLIPPSMTIPMIVSEEGSFDLISVIVGHTGDGKSSALRMVRRLSPQVTESKFMLTGMGLGSGEGIIDAYFGMVPIDETNPKAGKEKRQVYQGVHFTVDEGKLLAELSGRAGTTHIERSCTAWSGGTLSTTNASEDRKRHLEAGRYRFAMTLGIQPAFAGDLMSPSNLAQGFTGRLLFGSVDDPSIPEPGKRPAWPGELRLRYQQGAVTYTDDIVSEVQWADYRRRQDPNRDPLDAHRNLLRLKIAGVLAFVDNRLGVSDEDWALTTQIVDNSVAVRSWLRSYTRQIVRDADMSRAERQARTELVVEGVKERQGIASMAENIRRRSVDGIGRNKLARAVAKSSLRHRFDAALDLAVSNGWVKVEGDRVITL